MLVLSRKIGETILIGDSIELTVVAIHNNRVRLGVKAPLDIPVHREELRDKLKSDQSFAFQERAAKPCRN